MSNDIQENHEFASMSRLLKNFQIESNDFILHFGEEPKTIGIEIADLLKEKRLTHAQAYASLQYCYNLLRYESNFLQLPK